MSSPGARGATRDDPRPRGAAPPKPAAAYERELDVSVERIWENVLDWEHLPYLHSQAFSSIRLLAADSEGWRAEIGLPGGSGETAEVDVLLDRPNLCYSSFTVRGVGEGTDIVTTLRPRAERRTGIRVEFRLPWAPPEAAAGLGEFYRDVYVGLWDQDEEMMLERQRQLDGARGSSPTTPTAEGLSLGSLADLEARLPLVTDFGGRRVRVAQVDDRLVAHDLRCPHLGGPLDGLPLDGCEAVCPWHGYRFDVRTGCSSDGRKLRLGAAPEVDVGDPSDVRLRAR